jgi:hypothetical protein
MIVSAVAGIFGREHELRKEAGMPAAIAARVAALVRCKNSLRFHDLFIANYFLSFIVMREFHQMRKPNRHHQTLYKNFL